MKIDLESFCATYKEKKFFYRIIPGSHPPEFSINKVSAFLSQQTPTKSIVFDLTKYTESIVYSRPKRPAAF